MQDIVTLPKNLRKNILLGIAQEQRRRARFVLCISSIIVLTSVVGVVVSIAYALVAIYQSSFYTYLSLLFTDSDIVALHWKEFTFTLLESLPVLGVAICLIAVGTFLVSLQFFARNMQFRFIPLLTN